MIERRYYGWLLNPLIRPPKHSLHTDVDASSPSSPAGIFYPSTWAQSVQVLEYNMTENKVGYRTS
jgi:hypothetical protein